MTSYAYGYCRLSTQAQSADLQIDALAAAGVPPERIYTDTASGVLDSRPRLDEMLSYLRAGDTVIVWRLDRLGRNMRHLVETVTDFYRKGVGSKSLQEQIDTTSATGRLVFHVLAALAGFERDLLVERTRAGLVAARARGRTGGRPVKMTPEKLDVARRMLAAGKSKTVVAQTIGVSRPTLYAHLQLTAIEDETRVQRNPQR